ncbi:MAG: hypothetical protein ABIJ00_12565 [Candidatus Eisenbacteria bacterium]
MKMSREIVRDQIDLLPIRVLGPESLEEEEELLMASAIETASH